MATGLPGTRTTPALASTPPLARVTYETAKPIRSRRLRPEPKQTERFSVTWGPCAGST